MQPNEVPDPTADVPGPTGPSPLVTGMRTIADYWLAAYRGSEPHGIRKPAPDASPLDDEPPTFTDADIIDIGADVEKPDYKQMVPIPVVIMGDVGAVQRRSETYFIGYQELIGAVQPQLAISRELARITVRISNNGPGTVYLGHTESVGATGYPLVLNEAITLTATRDMWLIQQSGQVGPANVGVLVEYDKPIPD